MSNTNTVRAILDCVSGDDFHIGVTNITLALIHLIQCGRIENVFTKEEALHILQAIGENKETILAMPIFDDKKEKDNLPFEVNQ